MQDTQEFQDRIGRVDGLMQRLESAADPALRTAARELVQALVDLQGAGMERILEIVSESGEAGASIVRAFARDPMVSSLLILHDLHPDSFETRVQRAADKVRPLLAKRSANLEVLSVGEGRVHIRVESNGHGCGSGGQDASTLVRDALFEMAPDAVDVTIEAAREQTLANGFVPLTSLQPTGRP